jgi:phosphosulfolactate phosphohydrolase-like enzyme
LFETAPHADALREVGLADDIAFCARMNTCAALPKVAERTVTGSLRVVDAR